MGNYLYTQTSSNDILDTIDEPTKLKYYAKLNKLYRDQCKTAKLLMLRTTCGQAGEIIPSTILVSSYNYETKEDLAKQILNDDSHYLIPEEDLYNCYQERKYFVHNLKLFDCWKDIKFKDENIEKALKIIYDTSEESIRNLETLSVCGQEEGYEKYDNFYRNVLTKEIINKIYSEIGYERLIDHLQSINGTKTNSSSPYIDAGCVVNEYCITLNDGEYDSVAKEHCDKHHY